MRIRRAIAVGVSLATVLVGVGVTPLSASASGGPVVLTAPRMTGDQEVPGPGDPDGRGRARITLYTDLDIVCWKIQATRIELPGTAAHIHEGAAGVSGGIVVTLAAPDTSGTSQGCTAADGATMDAIIADPAGYYVNVHNIPYPAGAIRGQLTG
jgi:CHRD domain